MTRIYTLILLCLFSLGAMQMNGQSVERIEPPCWWIGMKTNLQLMVYGKDLSRFTSASVVEKGGIKIGKINKADSPNYLFLDISFPITGVKAGVYTINLTNASDTLSFKYEIKERRVNSAKRESFTPADMIYLLMPDRFVNGDATNDNIEGYPDKYNMGDYSGRHGGDLRGMINRLDYLSSLGATAVWSTPLTEDNEPVGSYHGYACSDYYKIDPRFGANETYREFVDKAHSKGIKVIMDVVTNHCGTAHWWMKDLPFNAWINKFDTFTRSNYVLTANNDPNVSSKDLELCNRGWFDTSMPDLKTENPFVLQYFKQLFVWWIEWANLDGLRVDTYPYNEKNAIAEWSKAIRKEYPNIGIVGECWVNEPALVAYWEGDRRNKDKYNSYLTHVMDFPLQASFGQAFSKDKDFGWGEGMIKIYNSLASDFLYERPGDLMIFLDNHDTERWADVIKQNPAKIKMGLTMLATMRGIPQLYYGTEVGLISKDLKVGHGSARVLYGEGLAETFNAEQQAFLDFTKKLFTWRKGSAVIHNGKTMHFYPTDNIYAYVRYTDKNAVLVVVNASLNETKVDWKRYSEIIGRYTHGKNVITGASVRCGEPLTVAAQEALVVEF